MNNGTNSTITLAEYEENLFIQRDIPVIVYLAILFVIGIIGNTQAIIVYYSRYKPSIYRTFVLWLATVDLVASVLCIPFEMFDIRFSLTFSVAALCKIFRGLNYFVGTCSGFLLGVIVVERFRKACKPLGRQLTLKEAKWACIITTFVAAAFSTPPLEMFGLKVHKIPELSLVGTECTVRDKYRKATLFRVYSSTLLLISTSVFLLCIILYTFIGKTLFQQRQFRRSTQTHNNAKVTYSDQAKNGSKINRAFPNEDESSVTESSGGGESGKVRMLHHQISNGGNTQQPIIRRKSDRSRQITIIFLVATLVSYLGYLPHLVLTLLKAFGTRHYYQLQASQRQLTFILVRSYFTSNVTNPIVYCFLDYRFRKEFKSMYKDIFNFLTAKTRKGVRV